MKVIFLDRDGVINKYPGDGDYVKSWEEFQFLPGAKEALKLLCACGYKLFVISNQAGIAKGVYLKESLDLITRKMHEALGKDIRIEGVYYCIHRPEDNCSCRKPKTGLIEQALAQSKFSGEKIELKESYFIGDTIRDIETGKSFGLKTVLVFSGKEQPQNSEQWQTTPDFTADDLQTAASLISKL